MANFNYYLNRQGVRGQKGEKGDKGDKGFSPYIDIKENTPAEFILTVHNEEESFDTPNLIPTAIGEKVTEMEVTLNTHTEDISNLKLGIQNSLGVVDAQIEAVNQRIDNQSYKIADLEIEVNNLSGEVASNSADITSIKNINTTQDSEIAKLKQKDSAIEESIEDLNHKYTTLGSEVSDLSIKKQNRLVAGSNITLTDNPTDGTTTISSVGGGGGEGGSPLDNFIEGSTNNNTTTISTKDGKVLKFNAPIVVVGDNLVNTTDSEQMQLYLKQGDIAAGDNVIVEKTATGIKISSSGGSGDAPIATTGVAGKVKPDGTTITVTEDGTISATGGGSIPDNVALKDTTNTFTEPQRFEGSSSVIRIASNASDSAYGQINRPNNESVNIQAQYGSPASLSISTSGLTYTDSNGVGHNLLAASTPTNMVTIDTIQVISGYKTFSSNSGILLGNQAGYHGNISAGHLYLGQGGSTEVHISANASNPKLEHYGKLTISSRNEAGSCEITAGHGTSGISKLSVEKDSLTYTKTDGTVVNLLSSGGSGDVTAAGDNIFTGSNTFTNTIKTQAMNSIEFDNRTYTAESSNGDGKFTKGKDNISHFQNYETDIILGDDSEYTVPLEDVQINASGNIILNANNNVISGTVHGTFPKIKDGRGNIILSQGNVTAGDNISIVKTIDGIQISSTSSSVEEKYGIEADYKVKHGIIDNPNGIISYNATNKDITVNQGLVLNCAGNGTTKTTITTAMTHTVTSTGAFTLFYANGDLLECGKVDYSTTTPTDNGVDNYQAWFNPDKIANPNQQWQFKSNDTGNVFRFVNSATPIADMVAGETGITSVSYLGYRVLDDDIFAHKNEWITKNITLLDAVRRPSSGITVDLSEYIPVDGYNYEALISASASPDKTTLDRFVALVVSNGDYNPSVRIAQGRTVVVGRDSTGIGSIVVPILSNRTLAIGGSSSVNNGGTVTLYLHAIRRIG